MSLGGKCFLSIKSWGATLLHQCHQSVVISITHLLWGVTWVNTANGSFPSNNQEFSNKATRFPLYGPIIYQDVLLALFILFFFFFSESIVGKVWRKFKKSWALFSAWPFYRFELLGRLFNTTKLQYLHLWNVMSDFIYFSTLCQHPLPNISLE